MIFKADALFKIIKYPALIHCKSGADRAGIVSYLYKILKCKADPLMLKNNCLLNTFILNMQRQAY